MPTFRIICIAVFVFLTHTLFIISQHFFHRTQVFVSAKGEQFSQKAPQHLLTHFLCCVCHQSCLFLTVQTVSEEQ